MKKILSNLAIAVSVTVVMFFLEISIFRNKDAYQFVGWLVSVFLCSVGLVSILLLIPAPKQKQKKRGKNAVKQ